VADKRNTYDWLNYAYRMESSRADSSHPYEETTDKETGDEYLSKLERIADGIMIKNLANRVVKERYGKLHQTIMNVSYRHYTEELKPVVDNDIMIIAKAISKDRKYPKSFVLDMIHGWRKRPTQWGSAHDLNWWAKHLGKPKSTIYSWAMSKDHSRKSIRHILDGVLYDSEAEVTLALASYNLL